MADRATLAAVMDASERRRYSTRTDPLFLLRVDRITFSCPEVEKPCQPKGSHDDRNGEFLTVLGDRGTHYLPGRHRLQYFQARATRGGPNTIQKSHHATLGFFLRLRRGYIVGTSSMGYS
jgi:hypothetical protein